MPNCFDTTGCARVRVVAIVETSTSFEAFRKKNKIEIRLLLLKTL